jgi:hypothetical protein
MKSAVTAAVAAVLLSVTACAPVIEGGPPMDLPIGLQETAQAGSITLSTGWLDSEEDFALTFSAEILGELRRCMWGTVPINIRGHVDEMERTDADAVVVCVKKPMPVDLGILEVNADGELLTYTEKPTYEFLVSTGMNVIRGSVVTSMEPGRIDMPDLLRGIQAAGGKVQCLDAQCMWFDLGRLEDFHAANNLLAAE